MKCLCMNGEDKVMWGCEIILECVDLNKYVYK